MGRVFGRKFKEARHNPFFGARSDKPAHAGESRMGNEKGFYGFALATPSRSRRSAFRKKVAAFVPRKDRCSRGECSYVVVLQKSTSHRGSKKPRRLRLKKGGGPGARRSSSKPISRLRGIGLRVKGKDGRARSGRLSARSLFKAQRAVYRTRRVPFTGSAWGRVLVIRS